MPLVEFLQKEYGKRVFSMDDENKSDDALCVGGVLCTFFGYPEDNYPSAIELMEHVRQATGTPVEEADLLAFAYDIIYYNDRKEFEYAWRVLARLIREVGLEELYCRRCSVVSVKYPNNLCAGCAREVSAYVA